MKHKTLADGLCRSLEQLTVPDGDLRGKPFTVLPYQRKFLRGSFNPRVKIAALSVARGNGKTGLSAALALDSVRQGGSLMRPAEQVILLASSFAQAKIAFDSALIMLRDLPDFDRRDYKIIDQMTAAQVKNKSTGARLRVLGADAKRFHGSRPFLVICDEPAQWATNASGKLWNAVRTSMGKRENGKVICIGTKPADKSHWFSKLLNPAAKDVAIYSDEYSAGANDKISLVRTWRKANPGLDFIPGLRSQLVFEQRQAKQDDAARISFKAYRLNMGIDEVEAPSLISASVWRELEGDTAEKTGRCVWGIDLGATAAMCAVAAFWPDTGRLEALAAFPSSPSLEDRERADGTPERHYTSMKARGELLVLGDKIVPVELLIREAVKRWGNPDLIVADRWRDADLMEGLGKAGVSTSTKLIFRGMGFKDGAEDVRQFRTQCLTKGAVNPQVSLLLRSAFAEAVVVADPAGNEKLAKCTQAGRRRMGRDDAAAASVLAIAVGAREGGATQSGGFAYQGMI